MKRGPMSRREYLRKTYADLLRELAHLYRQRASYDQAIRCCRDLLVG